MEQKTEQDWRKEVAIAKNEFLDEEDSRKLARVVDEVDAAYEEGPDWLEDIVPRENIHEYIAPSFTKRCGSCTYHRSEPYGLEDVGHHTIRISPNVITPEFDWRDTVRHELAHALTAQKWNIGENHSDNWRKMCEHVGANPEQFVEADGLLG